MSKPVRATTTLVHTPPPGWPPRPRRQSRVTRHSRSGFHESESGVWVSGTTHTPTASRPETQTPRSPQTTVACAGPRAGGAGPSTPRQRGGRARRAAAESFNPYAPRTTFSRFITFPAQGSLRKPQGNTLLYKIYSRLEIAILRLLYTVDNFLPTTSLLRFLRLTSTCEVELGGSIGFGAARRRLRAQRLPR